MRKNMKFFTPDLADFLTAAEEEKLRKFPWADFGYRRAFVFGIEHPAKAARRSKPTPRLMFGVELPPDHPGLAKRSEGAPRPSLVHGLESQTEHVHDQLQQFIRSTELAGLAIVNNLVLVLGEDGEDLFRSTAICLFEATAPD